MAVIDTNSNCSKKIALLKGKGVTAVGRYYRRTTHPSWRLTKDEAKKLSAAGIKIFTVFEDRGSPTLTRDEGKKDGQAALDQATQIGQPIGSAIYFAVEGLPSGYGKKDIPAIKNYFAGVKSAVGANYQLGVYGDGVVCEALLSDGTCRYTWLSASKSFPGTKAFYKGGLWALAQKTPLDQDWHGLSVDVNEAKADIGAFAVP